MIRRTPFSRNAAAQGRKAPKGSPSYSRPEIWGSPAPTTPRSPFNTPSATVPLIRKRVSNWKPAPRVSSAAAVVNSLLFEAITRAAEGL